MFFFYFFLDFGAQFLRSLQTEAQRFSEQQRRRVESALEALFSPKAGKERAVRLSDQQLAELRSGEELQAALRSAADPEALQVICGFHGAAICFLLRILNDLLFPVAFGFF